MNSAVTGRKCPSCESKTRLSNRHVWVGTNSLAFKAFGSSTTVLTFIRMLINRHVLQKLAAQSFSHNGMYGKMGMKIKPVSNPIARNMVVIGRNRRKMGKVFQSGSGGRTLKGSSTVIGDVSDTMDSQS